MSEKDIPQDENLPDASGKVNNKNMQDKISEMFPMWFEIQKQQIESQRLLSEIESKKLDLERQSGENKFLYSQ